MIEWLPADTAPEGVLVLTKIHDALGTRNIQKLLRKGRLWFVPDQSAYTYYTPTHWHRAMPSEQDVVAKEKEKAVVKEIWEMTAEDWTAEFLAGKALPNPTTGSFRTLKEILPDGTYKVHHAALKSRRTSIWDEQKLQLEVRLLVEYAEYRRPLTPEEALEQRKIMDRIRQIDDALEAEMIRDYKVRE